MNIKSLLLGSAAGLVAFSGAQAADAIVYADPEPVEYVRVCDVFGSGFFYIPGTETCLRVGGEIRFQVGTRGGDGVYSNHPYPQDTYGVQSRGRFFIDARSETELGTLRGFVRVDANRGNLGGVGNSTNVVNANKAFVELGGFKAGWDDSAWAFSPNAGAANYGSHSDSGLLYGFQQRNMVQYNFSGAGFFATISAEDNNANAPQAAGALSAPFVVGATPTLPIYANPSYMPDLVGRIGVNQAWGAAWAQIGYDDDRTNTGTLANAVAFPGSRAGQLGDEGYAVAAGLHFNVPNAPGSSLRVIGYYADSDNAYNGNGGEWSILGSYYHQFTPTFGASVAAQYISDLYFAGTDISSGIDSWVGELNVVWTPVRDFAIRGELAYQDNAIVPVATGIVPGTRSDVTSGFVRFSRFF